MRRLLIIGSAVLSGVCTLVLVQQGMNAAAIERPRTTLDMATRQIQRLRRVAETASPAGSRRVLYVGDSTSMHYPMFDEGARSRSIPGRLRSNLRGQSDRKTAFDLFTLVHVGQGMPDIYFLADAIVAAKPDIVLLTFNPAYTGEAWRTVVSHPELSGWLGFSRLFQASFLPLERVGVTFDRLLL
jgi:hypothetical protein